MLDRRSGAGDLRKKVKDWRSEGGREGDGLSSTFENPFRSPSRFQLSMTLPVIERCCAGFPYCTCFYLESDGEDHCEMLLKEKDEGFEAQRRHFQRLTVGKNR